MMGKNKKLSLTLLRSIFVYTFVILLCFACVFAAFFYSTHEKEEERRMATLVEQAAAALNDAPAHDAISTLERQLEGGVRYTLVDPAGTVLFDSGGNTSDNHADRPEIAQARERGTSAVTRYSSTLGHDTIYAAARLDSGNVLRVSEQRASFVAVLESTAPALLIALVVALALSVILSRVLAHRTLDPLAQIDVARPLENDTYEEMRPLLARIDSQQQQLKNQNSELARAEDMRREFSSNVSHELKTPLQVISGYAELLAQGGVPEQDAAAFAQIILSESNNMAALVDDVLTLSRIEDPVMQNAGKEEVELFALALEVVRRLEPLAQKKSVRVMCLGSTVAVEGNRSLLDQLASNLVSNAIKYSHSGGDVVVAVGKTLAAPGSGAAPEAYIKVKDSGLGIAPDEHDKIFERFYRVDKSRTKEQGEAGGTGLGLAIAKHAAAFHGATITVESELGRGSTFTVHIPLQSVEG